MQDYVIGVDIGGTNIKMGAVDYRGNILDSHKFPTEASLGSESILERLISHMRSLTESVADRHLKAAGFGIPGAIRSRDGIVTQAPNIPAWDGIPVGKILEERLGIPCYIENDANAIALGETWMGAGRGYGHVCCLTLGTGVGGGVIIDGQLLRGADGMAAELGHIAVESNGARCNCGSNGCLETFASATGMLRMLSEALPQTKITSLSGIPVKQINPAVIYQHARQGDPLSLKILQDAGRGLGSGLASLINVFNPEIIIIGGGVAASWDILMPPALEVMHRRTFKAPAERTKIVRAEKEDDAGIYGSAYVAWDALQRSGAKTSRERSLAPWGFWEVLEDGPDYKVKRLVVYPGHRLSYQKHDQREETWMVAAGEALVKLDGKEQTLRPGDTIRIPKTSLHRIGNPGQKALVFFEVQRGTYLGEDDIVRLEDDYRRQDS